MLGQHVPLRGPARLLNRSYARGAADPPRAEMVLTTSLGDVFQVDLASFQEWQLWAFGSFEHYVAELFAYLVAPGERCIDVGANVGVHTVRLAKLTGPLGEVIAIEPDPEIARRAGGNVALNGLSNVRIIQAAASRRAGDSVSLYRAAEQHANKAQGSLHPQPYLTGETVRVETITLDETCPGPVTLIKIDVEGHEAAVVAGAAGIIERDAPAIVFEYAPELLTESPCPFGALADAGYQMFAIRNHRHRLTGRGVLELDPLSAVPELGGDLLAVSPAGARRVRTLIRSA